MLHSSWAALEAVPYEGPLENVALKHADRVVRRRVRVVMITAAAGERQSTSGRKGHVVYASIDWAKVALFCFVTK